MKLVGTDGKVIAKLTVGENEHEPLAQALRERLGSRPKEQPIQVKVVTPLKIRAILGILFGRRINCCPRRKGQMCLIS